MIDTILSFYAIGAGVALPILVIDVVMLRGQLRRERAR